MDKKLPFSLRATPKIFSAVEDVVEWILQKERIIKESSRTPLPGVLYDYISEAGNINSVRLQKRTLLNLFARLGISIG